MLELLLLCAALALMELDTTYVGQFLISRPLVVGSVMGLLTGNLFLGLQIGVFTELIYLDFIPIGGVVPPSGAISAGLGVLCAYFFTMPVYFAFFAGIAGGIAFSFIEKRIRRLRSKILRGAEAQILGGTLSPGMLIFESLVFQYLCVFAFLIAALTIGGPLVAYISSAMPAKAHIAFKFSYFIVPWMGLAILFISFSTKPKTD